MRLIDADEIAKHIKDYGKGAINDGYKTLDPVEDIDAIAGIVDFMPTIEAEPVKHAHWIINSDDYYLQCSKCYEVPESGEYEKYCPNCGAKMDEVKK